MPGRKDTMMRALANVRPSHLLDPSLFDFGSLQQDFTSGQSEACTGN